ncbi:MAG: DNA repair protein [Cenarchaeum symbiont of Oopsacas minuta]|nr:DNA repair protein [Cenarchaeum symbiont of Oopsacas minuta]
MSAFKLDRQGAFDTINNGQVFLWDKYGDSWYGINGSNVIKIDSFGRIGSMNGGHASFFRTRDNMRKILSEISKDKIVATAVKKSPNMRLLRQDPFQCMITFVISSNSAIPNIRRSIKRLCIKYGSQVSYEGIKFSLFPDSKKLGSATIDGLHSCGLGYRAPYVKAASRANSKLDFDLMRRCEYKTAKDVLLDIPGIGGKVADCIMLFSLDKLDAVPLDRWVIRILEKYYPGKFNVGTSLTPNAYTKIRGKILDHFGRYAGFSQQFLFKAERDAAGKKWLE